METKSEGGWNFNYTTRDIVIIAVLVAIGGAVSAPLGNLWYLANSSLGPLGGALLQGTFMWSYILAMFLVRKPGTGLAMGILVTAVEVVLGNVSGIGVFGWGITQGLAVEVMMAVSNYKKFTVWQAVLTGAATSQFGTAWTAILYGWDPSASNSVWLSVPINLISGAVASGFLAYLLAKAIGQTGLVRMAE